MPDKIQTDFAPAERATQIEVKRQSSNISEISSMVTALEAVPHIVWALNRERQIVFSNQASREFLSSNEMERIYGLRPGEVLGCIHATEKKGGCGATESCSQCGAVLAILASQQGQKDTRECRISRLEGESALDLLITAMPLKVNQENFSIVSAQDISHEKRRRALERIFFHDILNIAGTVKNVSEMLGDARADEMDRLVSWLYQDVDRLIEEIQAQKDLAAAENNDLAVRAAPLNSLNFLSETVGIYQRHQVAEKRTIAIDAKSEGIEFTTDPTLLRRVIGNMLKNALEASSAGSTVTAGCKQEGDKIGFRVHNQSVMPREIQLQIFNRSFSTKGPGRGIGTYSIKLLTEKYLGGTASFTSSAGRGTTFKALYPLKI